jgi:hypothetical protein
MSAARSSEVSIVDVQAAFDGQRIIPGRVALKEDASLLQASNRPVTTS